MKTRQQSGFTLVELAIVLVVIGLILGMAFKGKDLIDSAKVKNMAAQYNKVVAGANTFYEKYGYYPGDGCPAAGSTIAQCNTAVTNGTTSRNGVIDSANEQSAFWNQLVNQTNILTAADRRSIFGQNWNISLNDIGIAGNGNSATGNQGNNFLFIGAAPATASSDARFVCALDRLLDDGIAVSGLIRSGGVSNYVQATDCWTLNGQNTILIRVLP